MASSVSTGTTQSLKVPDQLSAAQATGPLAKFYYGLWQDYPADFGGLDVNPNGTYVILEVGQNPTFEQAAQYAFDQIPAALDVTVPQAEMALTFRQVAYTLTELQSEKTSLISQWSSKASIWSSTVTGIGIDQASNRILIDDDSSDQTDQVGTLSSGPLTAAQQSMVQANSPNSIEFFHENGLAQVASRYADAAPWNGGDWITSSIEDCTTGPGAHIPVGGGHMIFLAGHCDWYFGAPYPDEIFKNNGAEVGPVLVQSVGGNTVASAGMDTAMIGTSSSPLVWVGSPSSTTSIAMYGDATPPGGGTVCEEGAAGGEKCGTVIGTGVVHCFGAPMLPGGTECVQGLDQVNGGNLSDGDSGGANWEPSIFGDLATGTNVGSGNGSFYSQDIEGILYVYSIYQGTSVVINTPSNP